jgi:hypothetical protein
MSDVTIFGNKGNFAIEIGATKKPKMFKLCFWINNLRVGLFTKAGKLSESVKAYGRFTNEKQNYYLSLFDTMKVEEIPFYLLGIDKTTLKENITAKDFGFRTNLYLNIAYFGEQFFNSNGDVFFLYRSPNVLLIICKKGVLDAIAQEVEFEYFKQVFEKYISYCQGNNLI